MPQPDRSFHAAQAFLVEAKQFLMADLFGAVRQEYDALRAGRSIDTPDQVARLMAGNTTHAFHAWMERHIQKEKYSGRWGLVDHVQQPPAPPDAPLKLDPVVPIPAYYSAIDTHQHPGNLHGAANAGFVYKASAGSTQPGATSGYELHERFAAVVQRHGSFSRVLDMGCGFGKSALPIAGAMPAAQVVGIDLSAPCLELAAAEARAHGRDNLRYEQADLRDTRRDDGEFDLVTSTMVLHELDVPALRQALQESYRVLAPGGTAIHLDFRVADPFLAFIYYGHALRNNEPYMREINELDLAAELRAAGFQDVKIEPFEEAPGTTRDDWPKWRLPWTTFVARKPA